ncbi:hypothetical protein J4216_04665 [Candidatus Woesearchaeota archaeon]|nr:hypothetical protein [Candidatus Woesearchaeota archaeon]
MKKTEGCLQIGVSGFDKICKWGIPLYSSILVTGVPGSGKSIFCLNFILEGAKNNEPGLIITTDESIKSMREYAKDLGLSLEDYEKKGLITLMEHNYLGQKIGSIQAPMQLIKKNKIKRVVLDSLSMIDYIFKFDSKDFRIGLLQFISDLKKSNINFLATSDRESMYFKEDFNFKPEDFLFDSLIFLFKIRKGSSFERCLHVAKLRGKEHSLDIYPFKIGKGGIKVYTDQMPFSLIENE